MNVQQLQATAYRYVAGTVQVPLVMLVWGALVLFFGYQYQANALLPNEDSLATAVSLESDQWLRAQQRNDRLLAALAAQTPAPIPSLLDPKAFAAQLAAQLANYEQHKETKPSAAKVIRSVEEQPKPLQHKAVANVAVAQVDVEQAATRVVSAKTAAKFVRLPAVVQRTAAMRVDALRASKDSARADLLAGRSNLAYKRLRGKIAQGRTDIEFLGLLALASLPQQPDEAEVIYQHLTQLQPDAQRWQQGLMQSQRLLAARSTKTDKASELSPSPAGSDGRLDLAG